MVVPQVHAGMKSSRLPVARFSAQQLYSVRLSISGQKYNMPCGQFLVPRQFPVRVGGEGYGMYAHNAYIFLTLMHTMRIVYSYDSAGTH